MSKILYLGTDPPPGVFHYPVIRTELLKSSNLYKALEIQDQFTHLIFTSKNGVRHWVEAGGFFRGTCVAIGESTADSLRKQGVNPLVAKDAVQEGVIALLDAMCLDNAFIMYPRSNLARINLKAYLEKRKIRKFVFDLYETVYQKIEPIPDVESFDEIVFTSPSTIRGFLHVFGEFPSKPSLKVIGPVTAKALVDAV